MEQNYYKIEIELEKFITNGIRLVEDDNLLNFTKLIREFKSYLFDIEELKTKFIENAYSFKKYKDTDEYKNIISYLSDLITKTKNEEYFFNYGKFDLLRAPNNISEYWDDVGEDLEEAEDSYWFGVIGCYHYYFDTMDILPSDGMELNKYINTFVYNKELRNIDFYLLSEYNIKLNYIFSEDKHYYLSVLAGVIHELNEFVKEKQIGYFTSDEKEIKEIIEDKKEKEIDFRSNFRLKALKGKRRKLCNLIINYYSVRDMAQKLKIEIQSVHNLMNDINQELVGSGIKRNKDGGLENLRNFLLKYVKK